MSNVESKSIGEAMGSADRRVNINVADISMEQRFKINALEQSVKDAMRAPNWKDIQEKYIKDRSSNDPNKRQSPEDILATAKILFDKVQAEESTVAGEQLNELTNQVLLQLNILKEDLGYSVTQVAVDARGYSETISQSSGADKAITESKNLPENMSNVEQLLGIEPKEKLESRTKEVASMMEDLKRPENATAFISAQIDYASLTDGLRLQDAIPTLDQAFKDSLTALQKKGLDPFKLRGEAMALVEKQLKGLAGLWKIITMHDREAITPEAHAETGSTESHEASAGELLTDEEMAEILQFLCEDVRGEKAEGPEKTITSLSGGLEATLKVVPAYKYYYKKVTGKEPNIGVVGGAAMGGSQSVINTLIDVESMGEFIGTVVGEKTHLIPPTPASKSAENWGIQLLAKAEKLMDGSTAANLKHMLVYGWENSTAGEKSYLVSKVAATLWSGDVAYGAAIDAAKITKLGPLGVKLAKLSSSPAVKRIAAVAETIASSCPSLAKFGFSTEKIATGLKSASKQAIHIWDHYVMHGVHVADKASKVPETYELTAGQYNEKVEEIEKARMTHSFAAEEMVGVQRDLNAALSSAGKLQLDASTVASLKAEKTEIEKRLGTS